MYKIFFIFIIYFLFVTCTDQSVNPADRKTFSDLDVFDQNKRIGRCINFGNALEAPQEGDWGITLQADYFQIVKDVGFNAIRLPVRFSAHALKDPPYTLNDFFMKRIDWALEQAFKSDLIIILDFHHYDEMMFDPHSHKDRYLSIWKQIAERYRSQKGQLIFELLNEPHNNLSIDLWNEYLDEAIQKIRKSNQNRTLIIGPVLWNDIYALQYLELPEFDDKIIVTFHYYDPFEFTHQGAEWVDESENWIGTTWDGTTAQKQSIEIDLDNAIAWSSEHNRPLFLGEFGVYYIADMDSRARWISFVARQCESRDISWAYWEFGAGFGVFDLSTYEWHDQLLNALFPDIRKNIINNHFTATIEF